MCMHACLLACCRAPIAGDCAAAARAPDHRCALGPPAPVPPCLQGQLLAGWLEYQRKNTWACVTWLTYSGYWMG